MLETVSIIKPIIEKQANMGHLPRRDFEVTAKKGEALSSFPKNVFQAKGYRFVRHCLLWYPHMEDWLFVRPFA